MNIRIILLTLTVTVTFASAEQRSRVVSAGLFKNGLASITREYTVPGPGTYTFDALGNPVHGTLWIESEGPVVARSGIEAVDATPEQAAGAGLHEMLLGKNVEIGLRTTDAPPFKGTLIAAPGETYSARERSSSIHPVSVELSPTMYAIELEGLLSYVAPDQVAYVRALEPAGVAKFSKPVMVFDVGEGAANPTVIRAQYLAHGLAWAPSYRIDLTDPETLSIGQLAVIRNELEDMEGVELSLISGFPNVEYIQAVSPFSADATWATFMMQLQQRPGTYNPSVSQITATSNISSLFTNSVLNPNRENPAPSYTVDGDVDLYYHAVGKQSLRRDAALMLTTGTASAPYEPIVEWRVNRNEYQEGADLGQDDIWDAVRFRNPFPFPMTTGPAMVESGGRFLGSKTVYWAAPGAEMVAYVGKALSIGVTYVEEEVSRGETLAYNRRIVETVIKGTMTIHNPRTEAVAMVIKEDLSGALVRADGNPVSVVGSAGPGQRNPSTKLTWEIALTAGEARTLTLEYKFLTD